MTLNNRKVYAGFVVDPPQDTPHDTYFEMLLLLSGYRDSTTMRMVQSANHADKMQLNEDKPMTFKIMLDMRTIMSANRFDTAIYERHFDSRLIADP